MTQDELHALFRTIDKEGCKRDSAMFRVLYCHGLRAHEIGLLQIRDYDDRSGRITIKRGKGSNGGQYRAFRAEQTSLRAWIRERGTAPGPLFTSRNHRAISRRQLDRLMKEYCALAGIASEKAHCHALKHSRATHLFEEGEDVGAVQDQLGHRNVQNTILYLHVTSKRRDELHERLKDKW